MVLDKRGQFMAALKNIKTLVRDKGIDLYMRDYILQLRMRAIDGMQPIWIAYNQAANRKLVYSEI